jgi:hypothetical protein
MIEVVDLPNASSLLALLGCSCSVFSEGRLDDGGGEILALDVYTGTN